MVQQGVKWRPALLVATAGAVVLAATCVVDYAQNANMPTVMNFLTMGLGAVSGVVWLKTRG